MNQLVAAVLGLAGSDIQVSGLPSQEYTQSRWREAILFYLFGVWSNKQSVMYRPKIAFGNITLRLDRHDGEYYAYGHEDVPQEVPPLGPNDLVVRSGRQADVEVALIRFVKDNRIKQLRLPGVPSQNVHLAQLVLWKKEKRSEYGHAGIGLPYSWGTKGPWWTKEEFEREL